MEIRGILRFLYLTGACVRGFNGVCFIDESCSSKSVTVCWQHARQHAAWDEFRSPLPSKGEGGGHVRAIKLVAPDFGNNLVRDASIAPSLGSCTLSVVKKISMEIRQRACFTLRAMYAVLGYRLRHATKSAMILGVLHHPTKN